MRPASSTSADFGQLLFRFRSFTPLPVILVLTWRLWATRAQPGPGGAAVDAALDVLGLGVALAGQALRFYTLGWVPEGTSGQRDTLEAATLNTRGPYAYVRNPLYVGNLGICLGLMLIAHDPWVYAGGLAFFFGEYFFIIRAEERFLRERFGAAFDAYCQTVRRWVPRWAPAFTGTLREGHFDAWRALRKEHNPFAAWASGALLLWAWETASRGSLSPLALGGLLAAELGVLGAFLVIKAKKHRWLSRA